MAITLTEKAASHVQPFLAKRGKGVGLRGVGVLELVGEPGAAGGADAHAQAHAFSSF